MLFASPRRTRTPWPALLMATGASLVLPAALGAVMMAAAQLSGAVEGGTAALWRGGLLLLLSPFLAGAGMVLVVPAAAWMLRLGWFGWLSAALLGLGVGAAIGMLTANTLAAPFGIFVLLILRATLGILCPMGPTEH